MDRAKLMRMAMGRVVDGMGNAARKAKRDKFMPEQQPLVAGLQKETPSMVAEAGMPADESLPGMMKEQGADIANENSLSDEEMQEILSGAK